MQNLLLICSFTTCKNPCWGKQNLCHAHYIQQWRGRELKPLRLGRHLPLEERIKQWKQNSHLGANGCWLWVGASGQGYGQVTFNSRRHNVYKLVWEFYYGPTPIGKELDHLCRIRSCWNPDHLEPVTHLENIRRGAGRGHETHCPVGHPYDLTNTYKDPDGSRRCRTCHREESRKRYHEQRTRS